MKLFRSKHNTARQPLAREDALRCIPVINTSVNCTELTSGEILLEYPLPVKPLLQSLYKRFQKSNTAPSKRLQLDEMGSIVWKSIDGEKSTGHIITSFAEHYGITLQEAELSVTTFFVELGKRGLIGMR